MSHAWPTPPCARPRASPHRHLARSVPLRSLASRHLPLFTSSVIFPPRNDFSNSPYAIGAVFAASPDDARTSNGAGIFLILSGPHGRKGSQADGEHDGVAAGPRGRETGPDARPHLGPGVEMAAHADLAEATGRTACPCDPRSPWQRGGPTGALAASSASSSPRARGSPTSPTRGWRGSRTCRTAGRGRRWGGGPSRRRWRSCCLRHLRPVQRPPDSAGLGLSLLGCCSGSARLIHRSTAKGSRAYSALLLPTSPHADDLQGWKTKRLTCSFIVLWH